MDITLLKILIFLSGFQRMTGLSARLRRWTQDGVLQLQRRAYEVQQRGTWTNLETDVPLTVEKQSLEDLVAESVPLRSIYVNTEYPKGSGDKSEEDFSPKALRSAKTWATQDTFISVGEGSLKKSQSKGESLKESDGE